MLRTTRACALEGELDRELPADVAAVHASGAAVYTQLPALLEPKVADGRLANLHRQLLDGSLSAPAADGALSELAWLRPLHFFDPAQRPAAERALAAALAEDGCTPAAQHACDHVLRRACRALTAAGRALGWTSVGGISLAQLLEAVGVIACLDPRAVAQAAPPWLLAPALGVAAVVLALDPGALCVMHERGKSAALRPRDGPPLVLSFAFARHALRWYRQVNARRGWLSSGTLVDAQGRRLAVSRAELADARSRRWNTSHSLSAAPAAVDEARRPGQLRGPPARLQGLDHLLRHETVGPNLVSAHERRAGLAPVSAATAADEHALAAVTASRELSMLVLALASLPGPAHNLEHVELALRRLSRLDPCGPENAFAVAAIARGLPIVQSDAMKFPKLAPRSASAAERALQRHVLRQQPAALVFLDPGARADPELALLALRGCRAPRDAAAVLSALRPECVTPAMLGALDAAVFDGRGEVLAALPRVLVTSEFASDRSAARWREQMRALLKARDIDSLDFFVQARFTDWIFHESASRGPTCPRLTSGAGASAARQPAARRPRELCRDFREQVEGMPRDRLPLGVRGVLEGGELFIRTAALRDGLARDTVLERLRDRGGETYARCALALNDMRFPEAPLQLPETLAAGRVHCLPLPRVSYAKALSGASVALEVAARADGAARFDLLHQQMAKGALTDQDFAHYTTGLTGARAQALLPSHPVVK